MASKSAYSAKEKGAEIEEQLDDLEKHLDRLKVMYEQYFLGIQKMAPSHLHTDAERRVRELQQAQIRNTALRYRFATLAQKYGAYNSYWRRTLRQIEQGRYVRDLSRIKREAERRGEEIPEELVAAMPKRMREKIARDREKIAEAAARGGKLPTEATAVGFDDIDDAEPAVVRSHPPREQVHRIDPDLLTDDLDFDRMFEAITSPADDADTNPIEVPLGKPTKLPAPAPAPAPASPAATPVPAAARTAPPPRKPPSGPLPRPQTMVASIPPPPGAPPPTGPSPVVLKPIGPPPAKPPPLPPPRIATQIASVPPPPAPPPPRAATPPSGTPAIAASPKPAPAPTPSVASPPVAPPTDALPRPPTQVGAVPRPLTQSGPMPRPLTQSGPMPRPLTQSGPRPAAPPRVGTAAAPAPAPPPGMSDDATRALYQKYLKARQLVGESNDGMTYDKLVRSLNKEAPRIMEQHKAAGVEFNVVVKDNKVILKAKPKKE